MKSRKEKKDVSSKHDNNFSWCVGKKPVTDLLRYKPTRVVKVFVTNLKHEICREFGGTNSQLIEVVDENRFNKIFHDIDLLNHQGVCAQVYCSGALSLDQLIKKAKKSSRGLLVGLDQVQDPHNLGSIFRASEALGADGLFFTSDRSVDVTPAVRRISVSSTEFLPYSKVSNLSQALDMLRDNGFWIFGTSLSDKSEDIEKVDIPKPLVLLFGSESSGLRALTEKKCDRLVHIKHYGITESLNVASAVSAMLFYVRSK